MNYEGWFKDRLDAGRLDDMTARGGAPELAFGGKAHRIFEIAPVHRRLYRRHLSP